ncbi:hypothetical protein JZ751_025067 [Albula glossodonta]|uniref:Uncharacterized protein n=1 Tax=Albula glossodonta TaxID=121402 RepID=A0A8T2PMS8_9TELE|nr:hypothetical protein JZ751_025067 [Albula glossodonta]
MSPGTGLETAQCPHTFLRVLPHLSLALKVGLDCHRGQAVQELQGQAVQEIQGQAVQELQGQAVQEIQGQAEQELQGRARPYEDTGVDAACCGYLLLFTKVCPKATARERT